MLILNVWGITFHAVVVFVLGKDILFKSVLGRCEYPTFLTARFTQAVLKTTFFVILLLMLIFHEKKSMELYTDYGHTKAKSVTLWGPNSNPYPK